MKIECYLSVGCASEEALRENIQTALSIERINADVQFYRITADEAVNLGLAGSPSVLINGKDIEPLGTIGFS